jgi:hypothetical protein
MTDVRHTAYISTGRKNAMFTLWVGRVGAGCMVDHYVCNLAATEELAEAKAIDYCERMSERCGFKVHFDGFDVTNIRHRRGNLSARDTANIEQIEAGVFPFGKHAGTRIADAPDGYVLFFADKHDASDVVTQALAAACMGVAMERDLIAKRQAARDEQAAQDALSRHVGEIGERLTITGEIVSAFYKEPTAWADGYTITKVRHGNDLFVYWGNGIGERGDVVTMKATVKRHDEYKGVLSTTVNRPKLLG